MKITVMLGGTSAERDVSIVSGLRVAGALRDMGHDVATLDPATGPLSLEMERKLLGDKVKTAPPSLSMLQQLSTVSQAMSLSTFCASWWAG